MNTKNIVLTLVLVVVVAVLIHFVAGPNKDAQMQNDGSPVSTTLPADPNNPTNTPPDNMPGAKMDANPATTPVDQQNSSAVNSTTVATPPPAAAPSQTPPANPKTSMITTPSGLQYVIDQPGTGAVATAGHQVTVHYTGLLTNGTKFDSDSDHPGGPFTFNLGAGQVIKGWDEGVAGMKVGEKRTLTIPANLGYGSQGAGSAIPPNATLIFHVELLAVK